MIDFWNIEITCPADLYVLHDALLESGARKWASCVRRLIKEEKFPLYNDGSSVENPQQYGSYYPHWHWGLQFQGFLPDDRYPRWTGMIKKSATEAIWNVIICGDYLEEDFRE